MSILKTMTIDDFYESEEARRIKSVILSINENDFIKTDHGEDLINFNMVPPESEKLFKLATGLNVEVYENSGFFRKPQNLIRFGNWYSPDDWLFVVSIDNTTFNLFEHKSGSRNAQEGYKFNYSNLFEWDLKVNYQLDPSQGILFRPWLFHSFSSGLVQVFNLKEVV